VNDWEKNQPDYLLGKKEPIDKDYRHRSDKSRCQHCLHDKNLARRMSDELGIPLSFSSFIVSQRRLTALAANLVRRCEPYINHGPSECEQIHTDIVTFLEDLEESAT